MNINESSLREYVNNVVKSILEDVFDSSQASAASRQNVKKSTKVLGASSPHTKELAKLHTKMKNSRFVYGIADSELDRRAADPEFQGSKPTLTPMKGKAWSGYDAIGGTSDRSVNTGIIKKVAAAIKKNKGKGGKVVSEGAVEKIKEKIKGMLGKTPKKPKAKKEQKPGLMSSIRTAFADYPKAKKEQKPGLMSSIRTAAGDIVGHSGIFDIL